jgi:hypothetical protein
MMKRRIALAALSAGLLLGSAIRVASADDWCSDDPAVNIKTPAGRSMVVKVTDYALGTQHAPALKNVTYSYVATPDLDGVSTDVVLTVVIPDDGLGAFSTKSTVASAVDENSHLYFVSVTNSGTSGAPIVHSFKLPVR